MKLYKRILCIFLSVSMILSLIGCNRKDAIPAESGTVMTEEKDTTVDNYLDKAQGFIDQEDYDSAISVLMQAKTVAEDVRLDEMLVQTQAMIGSLMTVAYTSEGQMDDVTIHGIYAYMRNTGMVRFSVFYTAKENTKLHLSGNGLYYDGDFLTTGQWDQFVFEIPADEVEMLDSFSLIFLYHDYEICKTVISGFNENTPAEETLLQKTMEITAVPKLKTVKVVYPSPTAAVTPLDAYPTIIDRDDDPNNVGIYNFAALEMSTGVVRFVVDYIAPEGMDFVVYSDNLLYESSFTATGSKDRFVFDLDTEAVKRINDVSIEFGGYPEGVYLSTFQIQWSDASANIALPMLSDGKAVGDSVDVSFQTDGEVSVHQFTRQYLNNQCFRYSLEVSAPEGLTMQILGPEGQNYHQPVVTTEDPTTAVFDLPWAFVALNPQIQVNFSNADGELLHSISALNGLLQTAEAEVSDPYSMGCRLEYDWLNYDIFDPHTVEVYNCTRQDLSNGFYRYSVTFTAPEGMSLGVSIGNDGETVMVNDRFLMNTEAVTTGEQQTVMFDLKQDSLKNTYPVLSFSAPGKNTEFLPIFASADMQLSDGNPVGEEMELTYIGNNFRSRNDVQIHDLTVQTLDNQMVRFKLTYTAAKGIIIKWLCDRAGGRDNYYTIVTEEDKQELCFDFSFEQLQEHYDFYVMFYDEDKARFVLPTNVNIKEWGVPGKKQETVHLTEVEFPGGFAKSGLYLEDIVREIEEIVQDLFGWIPFNPKNVDSVDSSMIQPLEVSRTLATVEAQSGITPYGQYYMNPIPSNTDLSDNPQLAYAITFSDTTVFPEKMPASFDANALLEWGKNPGLNVDVLHELGYTGKGAVIAYVDQPAGEHREYDGENIHLNNNTIEETSMHGPSVLSLLAGKDIGTAPEAVVHYYGINGGDDHSASAQQLYEIIELNKTLPPEERITMIGFSDNMDPHKENVQALKDAVAACAEAGIMVWFCGEYGAAAFLPLSDKDNPNNVIQDQWYDGMPELVFVPAGSRTSATGDGGEYVYWSTGGLSWTMPYVLGLYAIVTEIDPSLTQDDLRKMIVDTAYVKDGMRIVNPVAFVVAALEGVGRTKDAEALRVAATANTKYTYAVMNKSAMSKEDIAAAENYLKEISDSTVLVVDSSDITDAQQLYTILQADNIQRGGTVVGVQIIGNSELVPAFEVGYKTQYLSDNGEAVDDAGTMFTDLFYGNFDNNVEDLSKSYNVMDHFVNGWQVQLVPQWPVARLPLAKNEFTSFFQKYTSFMEETGLAQQELVNFSCPIFHQIDLTDDMGYFMTQMNEEFELLNIPFRLYGNQLGEYPVTTPVLGDFTTENLTMENQQGTCEFIINTHGQQNNIDKSWFENGQEIRESFVNTETINSVLSENYYYLNMMSCENGGTMKDNITTTALNGNCVGMFSATHVLSANGQTNEATVQELTESNFFYFWLHYLNALNEGTSRSDAFWIAQKNYANSLLAHSRNGILADGNYQFGLCNLLAYHNFGVLEPSRAYSCISTSVP